MFLSHWVTLKVSTVEVTSCHLLSQGFSPPSLPTFHLTSCIHHLQAAPVPWPHPSHFGHQIYCALLASWAHQSTWQVLVSVLLTGRQTIKTKFSDKSNTEREKCAGLWIIKPSKAIFLDWQDKCKFSEKAGFNMFHYLDTFYLLLCRQRRPPWVEWRGEPSVVINNRSVWCGWCRLCGMCFRGEGQRPSVSAALKIWCH